MKNMKSQFWTGFAVAVVALVGVSTYAYWGGNVIDKGNSNSEGSIAQDAVIEFSETLRANVVSKIGQPIEGFEPFMFMQVYPGLTEQDFNNVSALIGGYRFENDEIVYDTQGAMELHTAARAISDEGMAQLLFNVSTRLNINLEGGGTIGEIVEMLEKAPDSDSANNVTPTTNEPASGANAQANITGTITCLPHKGDGPHTMECAIGLKADDGYYYGLTNMNYPDMADVQDYVRVRGTLTKPGETNYDIVGSIAVTSLEKI
ncbi:hypothetical protein H7X87_04150 [Acetobacteraceae bacterium]|nr:hypothetical protein [Candidatus Parcubacteria bacterium]